MAGSRQLKRDWLVLTKASSDPSDSDPSSPVHAYEQCEVTTVRSRLPPPYHHVWSTPELTTDDTSAVIKWSDIPAPGTVSEAFNNSLAIEITGDSANVSRQKALVQSIMKSTDFIASEQWVSFKTAESDDHPHAYFAMEGSDDGGSRSVRLITPISAAKACWAGAGIKNRETKRSGRSRRNTVTSQGSQTTKQTRDRGVGGRQPKEKDKGHSSQKKHRKKVSDKSQRENTTTPERKSESKEKRTCNMM